jgi:6,7-dimethyl-8-ribityllumazine synthase
MVNKKKNLSETEGKLAGDASEFKFALIVSEWNFTITESLKNAAVACLLKHHVKEENIYVHYVPGTFELALGAQWIYDEKDPDAVLCLGCVIQGETRHFDFICDAAAKGITNLNLKYGSPFIFGVLTPDTMKQAEDRAGGKHGNKGEEAALTAIKMLELKAGLKKDKKKIGF